jgi:hypothetical protein
VVVLTAVPSTGYQFEKWSGDIDANTADNISISIMMDRARLINADFIASTPTPTPTPTTISTPTQNPTVIPTDIAKSTGGNHRPDNWILIILVVAGSALLAGLIGAIVIRNRGL